MAFVQCPGRRPGSGNSPAWYGRFLADLTAAFVRGGHRVVVARGEHETRLDVVLVGVSVPDGPGALADRIVEERTPLMLKLRKEPGRQGVVGRLVAVAEVPERLSGMSHPEVVRPRGS